MRAAALALLLSACSSVPTEDQVGLRLIGGQAALPTEVTALRFDLFYENQGDTTRLTIGDSLPDMPEFAAPALLTDLPTGIPILVRVLGSNGEREWIGHVGPVVLGPGERFYGDLRLYEVGTSTAVEPDGFARRFLHTATGLPDGRVLIAGGFTSATRAESCPAQAPTGATACFELQASRQGVLFDPNTSQLHEVDGGMGEARAGHTATLVDGRVLIAGGAPRAVLALVPGNGDGTVLRPEFVPLTAPDEVGAHSSFELFDPVLGFDEEDPDRNGDPTAGEFIGSAGDPGIVGQLNDPRFMHAAALAPDGNRVLLVGGVVADESFEVFDVGRAGGYGVYDNGGAALDSPRAHPSAVAGADSVWIFGGARASNNSDLAEIWDPGDTGNGAVRGAGDTSYPGEMPSDDTPRPELAAQRPVVGALNGGTHGVTSSWFGPNCRPGETTPSFATSDTCNESGGPGRSYVTDLSSGLTSVIDLELRAFGASAELRDFGLNPFRNDFEGPAPVVFSGGAANGGLIASQSVEVIAGDTTDGSTAAIRDAQLRTARFFHTSTAMPHRGLLTFGGIQLIGGDQVVLLDSVEVHYLDSPPAPNQ
ncbi:MAG: hypothetical protein AAGF12_18120 [Myxococcota bacterium]